MIHSICLLRNSNSCWKYGMDPTSKYMLYANMLDLFVFFHGHLIFVFESHRPNSQLSYPLYYRPGPIDTPCPCYSVCWLWRMLCILWRMLWILWTILDSFGYILVTIYLCTEYCFIVKVFSRPSFCFQFYIPFYCTYCIYFAPLFLFFSMHLYLCRILACG